MPQIEKTEPKSEQVSEILDTLTKWLIRFCHCPLFCKSRFINVRNHPVNVSNHLVAVSSHLVAVSSSLVAVSSSLVSVSIRLVNVSNRLVAVSNQTFIRNSKKVQKKGRIYQNNF